MSWGRLRVLFIGTFCANAMAGGMVRPMVSLAVVPPVVVQAAVAQPVMVQPVVAGTAHQALFSIAFSEGDGLAVGAQGAIQETHDGAKSWHEASDLPTNLALLGVAMNERLAIAVGQNGVVLTREAGGKWRTGNSGTENRLFGVALGRGANAVAVGAFGTALMSRDGGLHWNSIAPPWSGYTPQGEDPHLYGVQLSADGAITLAGEFGLILRTADEGRTWQLLHQGPASLFALELYPSGLGYAVGQSGTILRSTDGGTTWSESSVSSRSNLLSVGADASGEVVITAMREVLVSSDGLMWREAGWGDFGSAWYSGVAFAGRDAGRVAVLVGHEGRILQLRQ